MGILWRSAVAGLLVMGVVGIGAESAASTHWRTPPPARISKSITTQRITFTSTPPNPAVVGGTYRPRARGGASGNPVTFSIDPSAQGSCTISGDRVSFVAVGTCVIDANQAGNASYEAATQVQQSVAVASGSSPTWACTSNEPISDLTQAPAGWTGSTYYVTWENSVCGGESAPTGTGFWTDTTNFTGQNDPSGTGGLTQEIDQDMWSPICANATGGIVGLNDPTCVTRETQTLQANSAQDWQVTVNAPTNPSGAVTDFPNAWAHGYGGVLDDYTSLTSSVSVTMPNVSGVVGHAMEDDYLSQPGDTNSDYEVMIQYDRVNDGSCPSTASINGTSWNWGVTATDVMIDGSPWFLCDAQTTNGRGTNGGCPSTGSFCGAVVWKPAPVGCSGTACTDSNAEDDTCNGGAQASPCSATFDLKAMFQWLETHDPPGESYPYVEVGSSVNAIDSGFETSSTGGVARTFASSGFTVDATGAPST